MLTPALVLIGVVCAVGLLTLLPKVPSRPAQAGLVGAALVVLLLFAALSSFRYVPEDKVGVVVKNVGGTSLPPGKIIATDGEKGPQARILPPGWHPWLWPVIVDVELAPLVVIQPGEVGLLTAADGQPLPAKTTYAPEWDDAVRKRMAEDAVYFLTEGQGFQGPQTSVLTPGTYRINPKLFAVETRALVNVEKATVGVVKSNVGEQVVGDESADEGDEPKLVERGQRGVWSTPLMPEKYYLNTNAYEITTISTRKRIVRYAARGAQDRAAEEAEIRVRTSDGFTFPVDVRVEFEILPEDAPLVVAKVGDDREGLQSVLNSAVRATFRNNAEGVKALDYVQQRSQQESQSLARLAEDMDQVGVTITAVRIGDVGDIESLGELLQTQTDREIALQEQLTFQEQQRAAEQKKELTRTEQEAEEERRLATARYEVQIAEQNKEQRIIEASADAEAIEIRAAAQANAFAAIAAEIGQANAALIEVLKVVGERGIEITPRVMVAGEGGSGGDAETVALIGTMLDRMTGPDAERE